MSSDSEESSGGEGDSRLQSIWKSIKETKSLAHMTRPPQNQHENIPYLAAQLHKTQQTNMKLQEQLAELQQQLENAQQAEVRQTQIAQKLKADLRKIKASKENISNNEPAERQKTDQLTRENDRLALRMRGAQNQKRQLERQCQRLKEENQQLKEKLEVNGAESQLLAEAGKGEQLLELAQAHTTIERLVELLKRTKEFMNSPILLQAKSSHFLSTVSRRLRSGASRHSDKKPCRCLDLRPKEELLWSPAECYRALLGIKMKYDYLNEECIQQVLFQLGQLYGAKEDRGLRRAKQSYEHEIAKLKAQLQQSYDQLLAKRQIARLKKELRVAKGANKPGKGGLKQLREQGQCTDQLKLKEREVKLLQQRVRLFETENGFHDKSLYCEGALWAIDRLLREIEDHEGSLKQFEAHFRDRIQDLIEPEDWLRSYKQCFEGLGQLSHELRERLFALKENALRKLKPAQ